MGTQVNSAAGLLEARIVELVLKKCMGYRKGESVLIVTDDRLFEVAHAFYQHARALAAEVMLTCMTPREIHGQEPPESVARAMCNADVALLITTRSLSHTQARREACSQHGVRIASMPGVDPERLGHLLDVDYDEMNRHAEVLAEMFQRTREVRLTSAQGTELRMRIEGRIPLVDNGLFAFPGAFGNLPAGEVCLAPVEGTTSGVLVADGSMAGLGKLEHPIHMRIEHGVVVENDSQQLQRLLEPYGEPAFSVGELGIGVNPNAEVTGNILEDEKAIRTAHVALGDNRSFGGTISVPCHLDAVLHGPTLYLNGQKVPDEVLFGTSEPRKRVRPQPAPEPGRFPGGEELYMILFENANDAQYILDLETQEFIEVNPAFETLTGYTSEDIRSSHMPASKLIAAESRRTYETKRMHRREVDSERYDIKIHCKDGSKKPVEVSVQRFSLSGRTVVLGSMRDITEAQKMKRALNQRITEAYMANARIFALTEKIKNVPSLAPYLLNAEDEGDLFEKAGKLLCDKQGLAYTDITFYVVEDDYLVPRYSTLSKKLRRISLVRGHRYARIVRGEDPPDTEGVILGLPLKGKQEVLGLLEVALSKKEKELMDENEQAKKGYYDVLQTLANSIGLVLENLRLYETVHRQSVTDQLTGIHNRRYFDRQLFDEVGRATRYRRKLSLIIMDVDHFKQVNDTFGHKQGDRVLQEVARIFSRNCRSTDIVCRYGGDEFILLLPETPVDRAVKKAEHLRAKVRSHQFTNLAEPNEPLRQALSLGVSALSAKVGSADELVRTADEALYRAKSAGRNRVVLWEGPASPAD